MVVLVKLLCRKDYLSGALFLLTKEKLCLEGATDRVYSDVAGGVIGEVFMLKGLKAPLGRANCAY